MSQEFGRLLRKYRKSSKLTQQELIDRINSHGYEIKSKATVSRWENGTRRPKQDVVEELESILHIYRGLLLDAARYPIDVEYVRDTKYSDGAQLASHQKDMLKIAKAMLANGLEYLSCRHINEQSLDVKIYSIRNKDGLEVVVEKDWDVIRRLRDNYVKLHQNYNPLIIKCFCEHLETGYPEVVKDRFQNTLDQNPYQIIETLRMILAQRKVRGTCQICKARQ